MKKRIFYGLFIFSCLGFIFDWNSLGFYYFLGMAKGIDISDEAVGIGIVIGFHEEKKICNENIENGGDWVINHLPIEVKKIFDGSPAQKTGIRIGDQILAINGTPVEEIGAKEISGISGAKMKMAEKLRQLEKEIFGPEGTYVVLRVKRDGCIDEKSGGSGEISIGLLSIDFTVKREKKFVVGEGGN